MKTAAIAMGALLMGSVGLADVGLGRVESLPDAGSECEITLRAGAMEPGAWPYCELLFTGSVDWMRDAASEEEDRRVAARVNAILFDKGRRDPFLPCDDDADALPLPPMAHAEGVDALGLSALDFWAVELERQDPFDAGFLAKHLHRRATPIDRGIARLGAEALRNYVKPYVNSTPGERFRLDERFLGGAAVGGVLYYRPGMTGWGFGLGVFRTPESNP